MSSSSFRRPFQSHQPLATRRRAARRAIGCAIEAMEQRVLFSVLTVNTVSDSAGPDTELTLREAVTLIQHGGDAQAALGRSLTADELAQVNDATDAYGVNDTIVFDNGIAGGSIDLAAQITISGTFKIDGGDAGMTITGGASQATHRALLVFGDLTLEHLTITNFSNRGAADTNGGEAIGGAIVNQGSLTILGCTFSDNSAIGGDGTVTNGLGRGGAIYTDTGSLTIRNSTFVGNAAVGGSGIGTGGSGVGGALEVNTGTILIVNSTFTQNSAIGATNEGGAMNIWQANTTLQFVTVSDNVSTTARGIMAGANASFVIENSILGQSDNSVPDVVLAHGAMSGTDNLIRNTAASGLGVISSADPMLGALGNHGGLTQTLAPQVGSPVIDVVGPTAETTDQRGLPRVYGAHADLGAHELTLVPILTNATSTTFTSGAPGSFTFTTVTDGTTPTIGQVGTLPTGVTFTDNGDGTATLAGTPSAGGQFTFDVTAANGTSPDDVQTFTLNVNAAPAITSGNTMGFLVGVAGTFTVTTTGYPDAVLTHVGTLPSGVTFTDNGDGTATLAGTPAGGTGGDHSFTINADNGIGTDVDQAFTLTVDESPTITSANHATFVTGQSESFTVTTAASPDALLNYTGTLPTGVTFTDNGDGTATLAGTPAGNAGGEYVINLTAANGNSPDGTQSFTLTVKQAPVITSANTASFTVGIAGTFTVTTSGYPNVLLSHTGGTLPAGLSFDDNGDGTATIAGTPADGAGGDHTITIKAVNNVFPSASQTITITVTSTPAQLVAIGSGAANAVEVLNPDGTARFTISEPLEKKTATMRLGSADLTGDDVNDIVVAAGPNGRSEIAVFDGATGDKVTSFSAFGTSFKRALFVTTGDVNHDGTPDVIVGQGWGASAKVKVFSGADQSVIAEFRAFGGRTGANVTSADLDGDGYAEVIATQSTGNVVKVFDGQDLTNGTVTLTSKFKPFGGYDGGSSIATGDVNDDGTPDIVVGKSTGRNPAISVFSGTDNAPLTTFTTPSSRGGVRVTVNDFDGDGHADIYAGAVVGQAFVVKVFSGVDNSILDEYETDLTGKLSVG